MYIPYSKLIASPPNCLERHANDIPYNNGNRECFRHRTNNYAHHFRYRERLKFYFSLQRRGLLHAILDSKYPSQVNNGWGGCKQNLRHPMKFDMTMNNDDEAPRLLMWLSFYWEMEFCWCVTFSSIGYDIHIGVEVVCDYSTSMLVYHELVAMFQKCE